MTRVSDSSNSFFNAIVRQRRVMGAIMLRNIRTRFFGHGLGYLIAIAWPLVHMVIVVGIYAGFSRAPAFGESGMLFVATGTVPFMAFSYLSRFMMTSLLMTRPLLAFPEVKILDVMFASAILEVLTSFLVVIIMLVIGWSLDVPVWPRDIVEASYAIGAAILLGVGFGLFNGVLSLAFPMWATVYSLLLILAWMFAGVLFIPSAIPDPYRTYLAYNPIIHAVEWMRYAFYDDYSDLVLDRGYLLSAGVGSVLLGLLLERGIRGHLLAQR